MCKQSAKGCYMESNAQAQTLNRQSTDQVHYHRPHRVALAFTVLHILPIVGPGQSNVLPHVEVKHTLIFWVFLIWEPLESWGPWQPPSMAMP